MTAWETIKAIKGRKKKIAREVNFLQQKEEMHR